MGKGLGLWGGGTPGRRLSGSSLASLVTTPIRSAARTLGWMVGTVGEDAGDGEEGVTEGAPSAARATPVARRDSGSVSVEDQKISAKETPEVTESEQPAGAAEEGTDLAQVDFAVTTRRDEDQVKKVSGVAPAQAQGSTPVYDSTAALKKMRANRARLTARRASQEKGEPEVAIEVAIRVGQVGHQEENAQEEVSEGQAAAAAAVPGQAKDETLSETFNWCNVESNESCPTVVNLEAVLNGDREGDGDGVGDEEEEKLKGGAKEVDVCAKAEGGSPKAKPSRKRSLDDGQEEERPKKRALLAFLGSPFDRSNKPKESETSDRKGSLLGSVVGKMLG